MHNVDVHYVDIEGTEANLSDRLNQTQTELLLNHYGIQSKDHYDKFINKISEHHKHHEKIRPNRDFAIVDVNDLEDTRLKDQNNAAKVPLKQPA